MFSEEESTLNGDDVPLVEEMVEDLLDEDSVESPKIAVNADNFMHTVMQMNKAQVVYMCSSLLQLAVGSHDLSQAEKEITACKADRIHKKTSIFTQKDNFRGLF